MAYLSNFQELCKNIQVSNLDDFKKTAGEIAKKLNKKYYNADQDANSHMFIVGSVGRNTAIDGVSDLDLLFVLPNSVYEKFNSYSSCGQSALLQEVKNVICERFPNTVISGDGQVVVIEFNKYTVELVPAFDVPDNKFKYPDTHDGGSWKITDPLAEQEKCCDVQSQSNNNFYNLCRIIRCWKDENGVSIGGLLIDSFIYDVFKKNDFYSSKSFSDYYFILRDIFKFLSEQNRYQNYWLALGSNQFVYNKDEGKFVNKAKYAYRVLNNAIETNTHIDLVLNDLLGNSFPTDENLRNGYTNSRNNRSEGEEFYYEKFKVNIKYWLELECDIKDLSIYSNNIMKLSILLENKRKITIGKQLSFRIVGTNCPEPYDIYWKVRNRGENAIRRNMERGAIVLGEKTRIEHSDFAGPHYVECYLVKNGICVAKNRVSVPIE